MRYKVVTTAGPYGTIYTMVPLEKREPTSRKYRVIIKAGPYHTEGFSECYAYLETNGKRYRVRDGRYTKYLTLREGRALLRKYREARVAELKGNHSPIALTLQVLRSPTLNTYRV